MQPYELRLYVVPPCPTSPRTSRAAIESVRGESVRMQLQAHAAVAQQDDRREARGANLRRSSRPPTHTPGRPSARAEGFG